MEKCQEDFELISKNLKDEIRIFEVCKLWIYITYLIIIHGKLQLNK